MSAVADTENYFLLFFEPLEVLIFFSIQRSNTVFLNFQRLPNLKAGIWAS